MDARRLLPLSGPVFVVLALLAVVVFGQGRYNEAKSLAAATCSAKEPYAAAIKRVLDKMKLCG